MADAEATRSRAAALFPALFVLLWSTGFIAAKYGLPYAPPFAFLFYRFALVAALMVVVSLATGARWPLTYCHLYIPASALMLKNPSP